jgi:hypothetical protein
MNVMPVVMRTLSVAIAVGLVLGAPGSTAVHAASTETAPAEARPTLLENFGFPFGFDVSKMDLKADPRQDFRRYAAGHWIDAATLPSDRVRVSGIDVLMKRVEVQVQSVLDDTMRGSVTAAKGSPTQQVGDFYASGMDTQLCSAITRSRRRGHQQIFVMQATQHRSDAHADTLADPMAGW